MRVRFDKLPKLHDLAPSLCFGAILITLLHIAMTHVYNPRLSPDSWSYLELAKTIGGDFYHFNTWRSFASQSEYSLAFPPLWPTLIAAVNQFLNIGIYAAYFLNFLIFVAFTITSEYLARLVFDKRNIGLFAALMLLVFAPFKGELIGARSIPLQLLLFALLAICLVSSDLKSWLRAICSGVLMGLLIMNRFDALPAVVMLLLIAFFLERNIWVSLLSTAMLLLVISPWMDYSLQHFGKLFTTDNAAIALSAQAKAHVTDFNPIPPATLFDEPLAWLTKVLGNIFLLIFAIARTIGLSPAALIIVGSGIWLYFRKRSQLLTQFKPQQTWHEPRQRLILFGLGISATFPAYLLTGYFDLRYFSAFLWWLLLVGLPSIYNALGDERSRHRFSITAMILFAAALVYANGIQTTSYKSAKLSLNPSHTTTFEFDDLLACLESDGASPRDGVFFEKNDDATKFGALTGWRTILTPKKSWKKLDSADFELFFKRFNVRYMIPREKYLLPDQVQRNSITLCDGLLYRLPS